VEEIEEVTPVESVKKAVERSKSVQIEGALLPFQTFSNYSPYMSSLKKVENDELGGLTGGQGHLCFMLGGSYRHSWLSGATGKDCGCRCWRHRISILGSILKTWSV